MTFYSNYSCFFVFTVVRCCQVSTDTEFPARILCYLPAGLSQITPSLRPLNGLLNRKRFLPSRDPPGAAMKVLKIE